MLINSMTTITTPVAVYRAQCKHCFTLILHRTHF